MAEHDGTAGVRLDAGRGHLHFVRGVPAALPDGAVLRFALDGALHQGTVTIPPSDVVWCDPEARCADFVSEVPRPDAPVLDVAPRAEAILLADEAPPDRAMLAARLALAWEEIDRLDDPAPLSQPRPDRGTSRA